MKKILVTGGTGMVGTALQSIIPNAIFLSSKDVNLISQKETFDYFKETKPTHVIHLAARVGGIKANMENLADFYYQNVMINTNVLEAARVTNVDKVLSMLSTCVYPSNCELPLKEIKMHAGPPHDSNYGYAFSKRMLEVQSRTYRHQYGCNFISVISNNLFGENDNFHLTDSHVIPALIRKIYEAKNGGPEVLLWGDGSPLREFTYSKDLARIIVFLLETYNSEKPINIGNTKEYSIKEIAYSISKILDYNGNIKWDVSQPMGQYRKPSDNSALLNLGWDHYTDFYYALEHTCRWFVENYNSAKGVII